MQTVFPTHCFVLNVFKYKTLLQVQLTQTPDESTLKQGFREEQMGLQVIRAVCRYVTKMVFKILIIYILMPHNSIGIEGVILFEIFQNIATIGLISLLLKCIEISICITNNTASLSGRAHRLIQAQLLLYVSSFGFGISEWPFRRITTIEFFCNVIGFVNLKLCVKANEVMH